jgi:cytochrome c oxidase assembly factor CtaG
MQSETWHEIEQASFFVAGLLFWLPLIQPWPSFAKLPGWAAPLYLFLATLPCDVLSAFLTFCDRVVYPHYSHAHPMFGMSPLGDQEFAGALMWVCITFAYLTPAAVITIQLLSPRRSVLGHTSTDSKPIGSVEAASISRTPGNAFSEASIE